MKKQIKNVQEVEYETDRCEFCHREDDVIHVCKDCYDDKLDHGCGCH